MKSVWIISREFEEGGSVILGVFAEKQKALDYGRHFYANGIDSETNEGDMHWITSRCGQTLIVQEHLVR